MAIRDIANGKYMCHNDHDLSFEDIYVDSNSVRRCKLCRKETQARFKERNPSYFRDKNKAFRQTELYKDKTKKDRAAYREQWLEYFR